MSTGNEEAGEPEVLVEQRDRILIITINRPKAKNAVNAAVANGLAPPSTGWTTSPVCRSAS